MHLPGQGAGRRPDASGALDDRGYIMVALLIGIAVSAIWMSALLPAWRQQAIRQKEADLVFRGEQYARAIALYWRKNNQTLPPSLDVLVTQRYLRKKYPDPITGKDFLPVGAMQATMSIGSQGQGSTPGQGSSFSFSAQSAGISGVRSTSKDTSIIVYRGQTAYSQFPFDYTVALQRMGAGLPPGGGGERGGGMGPSRGGRGMSGRDTGGEVAPEFPMRGRGGAMPEGPARGGRIGN